ncbi:hypothetical protein FQZ97_994580 [compost metagenome]
MDLQRQRIALHDRRHVNPVRPPVAAPPGARAVKTAIAIPTVEIRVIRTPHHYLRLRGSVTERDVETPLGAGFGLDQAGRSDAGPHHILIGLVFEIIVLRRIGRHELVGLPLHARRPLLKGRHARRYRGSRAARQCKRPQHGEQTGPAARIEHRRPRHSATPSRATAPSY